MDLSSMGQKGGVSVMSQRGNRLERLSHVAGMRPADGWAGACGSLRGQRAGRRCQKCGPAGAWLPHT